MCTVTHIAFPKIIIAYSIIKPSLKKYQKSSQIKFPMEKLQNFEDDFILFCSTNHLNIILFMRTIKQTFIFYEDHSDLKLLFQLVIMSKEYQLDHSLDDYIQTLIKYGVTVNRKLQPAFFFLKNGLQYPGLLTNEAVDGVEELVRVPIDLILTSHKALKDPEVQELFNNTFYKEGLLWQDRILVTYLLYLLSINRNCLWTYMAQHFSKDIDIISFWNEDQLGLFIDHSVVKAAKKQRQHFENEYERFQQLREEYSILQDDNWFNKENYKWIYTHAVSRCFGSYLNSTYFVPYCELFNHNNVDVSYRCLNDNKIMQETIKEDQSSDFQQIEVESISSCYSQDYLSDDDFDYLSINSYSIKWLSKISYDLKEKQVKKIDGLLKEIYDWLNKQLEWRGFTLIYLGQIIEKLKILENQYKAGRKKFQQTIEKLEETKLHVYAYRKYLVESYRTQGREYQKVMRNERGVDINHVKNTSWTNYNKSQEEKTQEYTHFVMEARELAHFEKDSQIYFSYGKLSNRTLLVRYGFCLEDNPFEHVWVKNSLRKDIEPYPDLFDQIQEKGLPINYKMKLKPYTFAMQPIILMRMKRWKLTHHRLEDIFFITDIDDELKNLEKVKQMYVQSLQQYISMDEDLTDPKLGYHQYFAKVYNVEKKKIIQFQLNLIEQVQTLFAKIKSHDVDVKEYLKSKQWEKPLRHYLRGLRGLTSF